MSTIEGIFAATVTPFGEDGLTIKEEWIPKHLAYLQSHGCDGVVPMGSNGEGPSLNVAERQALLEEVMAHNGSLKVIPGTGAASLSDTIALTRHAFTVGADAVLIVPPFYWKQVTLEGALRYFRTLFDKALQPGQQVLLYNIPQLSYFPITHPLLDGLLATHPEAILGIKDSTGNLENTVGYITAYPQLTIIVGSDRLAGPAQAAGAKGTITAGGNVIPHLLQAVRRKVLAGENFDPQQQAVNDMRALLEKFAPMSAAVKVLLTRLADLPFSHMRPPLADLPLAAQQELLDAYGDWQEKQNDT